MPLFNPDQGTTVIFGDAPPRNLLVAPDDGINSPWRWAGGFWVGQPWAVTWTTGDVIPSFALGPDPDGDVILYVGEWSRSVLENVSAASAASDFGVMESFGPSSPSGDATATGSGTGVAFLMQYQTYQPDPLAFVPYYPPNPEYDVRDYLGTDVTVDGTFTFPPEDVEGDGEDGYYFIDLVGQTLYGPRGVIRSGGNTFSWPGKWISGTTTGASLAGFDPAADYTVTGDWVFSLDTVQFTGLSSGGTTHPAILLNGDSAAAAEPASSLIPDAKLAIWFESTVGSTAVHFKGKDDDGTVKTGSITLT